MSWRRQSTRDDRRMLTKEYVRMTIALELDTAHCLVSCLMAVLSREGKLLTGLAKCVPRGYSTLVSLVLLPSKAG